MFTSCFPQSNPVTQAGQAHLQAAVAPHVWRPAQTVPDQESDHRLDPHAVGDGVLVC